MSIREEILKNRSTPTTSVRNEVLKGKPTVFKEPVIEPEVKRIRENLIPATNKLAEANQAMNAFAIDDASDVQKKSDMATSLNQAEKVYNAEATKAKIYEIPKKYDSIKQNDSFGGTFKAYYDVGSLNLQKNKAISKMIESPTPENIQLADTINKTLDTYIENNRKAMYYTDKDGNEKPRGNAFNTTFAEFLPQFVDQAGGQVLAQAAALGVAAMTGGAGYLPTAKLLGGVANYAKSFENMRGGSYEGLVNAGVSKEKAIAMSRDEAFISSLVETASYAVVGELLGFNQLMGSLSKLGVETTAKLAAKTGMQSSFAESAKRVLSGLARYGLSAANEYGEEYIQSKIGTGIEKAAMESEGLTRTTTAAEDEAKAREEGRAGGTVGLILGGLGLGITGTMNSALNRVGKVTPVTPTPVTESQVATQETQSVRESIIKQEEQAATPTAPTVQENVPQGNVEPVMQDRAEQTTPTAESASVAEKAEVVGKGNMGEVVKIGNSVYKNTVKKDGTKTLEGEVYQALKGNDNVLSGEVVTVDGVEKIKTPYSKTIVSTDAIPIEKRAAIGKQIIPKNIGNILEAINDLSDKGYYYSDPLQFAFADNKLKLMDFSNVSKAAYGENALSDNYSLLKNFLTSFGQKEYAEIISNGIRFKEVMQGITVDDIKNGDVLLSENEANLLTDVFQNGIKPENVYYTTNDRAVQIKGIAQTDKIGNAKYVFSEKPLSEKQIKEYELNKIYVTPSETAPQNTNAPLQLNINNAIANPDNLMYNTEKGGNVDGYTGAEQNIRNGIPGVQRNLDTVAQGWDDRRENLGVSGQLLLNPELRNILNVSGVVDLGLRDSSNNSAAFVAALDEARNADKNGWAVSPQTEESLKAYGIKTYLSSDGLAGVGVKADGDITAVFKHPNKLVKGSSRDLMAAALANGGNKLDCYGSVLAGIYAQQGFIPVARVRFIDEYANVGWDESKGRPDIYFMMHNGDSVATVAQKFNQYPTYSQAQLDALPLMEYDAAYTYRDNAMHQTPVTSTQRVAPVADKSPITTSQAEALEEEFFGQKLFKIDLQLFAEKFRTASQKLKDALRQEKVALRFLAKEEKAAAIEKLSQKYDAKIEKLNSLIDAEKYKSFWKSELDKKEFRDRINYLRVQKNTQISELKKQFSEKLKDTKKEYTVRKNEALKKMQEKARLVKEANRAKAKERAEINKKLEQLRKIDLKHMRPEYKTRIEALLAGFDVTAKNHTTRKLAELQRLQQYITDNPDHNIPDRKLKELEMLSKKTFSQITADEFDSIYQAVVHLSKLEQLKDKLIMKGRYREAGEVAAEATENVLKGKKILIDPTSINTNNPEYSRNYIKEFYYKHLNPETLTIISDGKKDGIIKQVMFDDMYEGHSNTLQYRQESFAMFENFLQGLGDDLRNWSRTFNKKISNNALVEIPISPQANQTIKKIKVTKAEKIYIYLASDDKDARRSMLSGGVSFGTNLSQVVKLTEADLQTVAGSMTTDEKKFADLAKQYFKFARKKINEVWLELNGYELIQDDKGYITIKRNQDFVARDYLKMRNKSQNISLEGMYIFQERTNASTPIVADDIFRVLVEHIEKVSAYYGMAAPLRNAKMLLNNPKLKNAYRQTGSYNIYSELSQYLQDVETKSIDTEFIDQIGYSIQNKLATAALGLNPFTILKQFSSYALETNEVPAPYLIAAQFTKTDFDEISKYSPILADRAGGNASLELGEIGKIAKIRSLFGNYNDIPQLLTKGIVAADREIIGKTWNAVKTMIKDKNPNIEQEDLLNQTARKVEEVLRHTNSASTMFDRSSIGRSKSLFTRAATMFTSQTNIMFNSVIRAQEEFNQSKKTLNDYKTVTKKIVTVWVVANLIEQAIDRLRDKIKGKDEPWNIPMDIVEGILAQVYFVGKAFTSYQSKVKYGKYFGYDVGIPQLQLIDQLVDYATDITTLIDQVASEEKYKSGDKKGELKWKTTIEKLTNSTFSVLSKLAGLPYDSVKGLIEPMIDKK